MSHHAHKCSTAKLILASFLGSTQRPLAKKALATLLQAVVKITLHRSQRSLDCKCMSLLYLAEYLGVEKGYINLEQCVKILKR